MGSGVYQATQDPRVPGRTSRLPPPEGCKITEDVGGKPLRKRGIDRLQFQMLYLRGGTRTRNPREQTLDKSCTLPHSYRGNPLVEETIHLSELLLQSTEIIIIHAGSNMRFEPWTF